MGDRSIAALLSEQTWKTPARHRVGTKQPIQGLTGVRQDIKVRKNERRLRASFTLEIPKQKQDTKPKVSQLIQFHREARRKVSAPVRPGSHHPQPGIIYSPRPAPVKTTVKLWRQDIPMFPSPVNFRCY